MKNVLVIPSGTEIGLEIHDALVRRRDVALFGAESTSNSHAAFVFTRNDRIPDCASPDFVDAVNRLIEQHDIHCVFPAHDDVQLALLAAGPRLRAPVVSSPLETVEVTRFKSRTYDLLGDVLSVPAQFDPEGVRASDFPVFVKPDRGQGSQRTHVCANAVQLAAALQDGPGMLICEFLPGPEVTVDCFSDRDRGLLFVGERLRTRVRAGISVRSERVTVPNVEDMARAIAGRLRLHGAWFFQVKERAAGDWALLEIGARVSGGATYQRMRGINLPLLTLFEHDRRSVDILPQPFDVVMDRAFVSRFRLDIAFGALYVDFDDTLCLRGAPNPDLVALIVLCRHLGKRVVLLTRNHGDCHAWLERNRIAGLFDQIILIDREAPKTAHIEPAGLLVDDSFAERKACQAAGVLCFDVDAISALIQHLKRVHPDE